MCMTIEGYRMLTRALKYYGYEKGDEVKKDYLEELIQNLRVKNENNNPMNVSGLSDKEYSMIAYRYGFFDGKVKLFMQTASTFSTTVDYVRKTEERTVMKIIKALKGNGGKRGIRVK